MSTHITVVYVYGQTLYSKISTDIFICGMQPVRTFYHMCEYIHIYMREKKSHTCVRTHIYNIRVDACTCAHIRRCGTVY